MLDKISKKIIIGIITVFIFVLSLFILWCLFIFNNNPCVEDVMYDVTSILNIGDKKSEEVVSLRFVNDVNINEHSILEKGEIDNDGVQNGILWLDEDTYSFQVNVVGYPWCISQSIKDNVELKNIELSINGKEYVDNISDVLNLDNNSNDYYLINMSWNDKYSKMMKLQINVVNNEMFESLKQEKSN